jgi:predicted  nucleic acid-binding Zn ribbon protein
MLRKLRACSSFIIYCLYNNRLTAKVAYFLEHTSQQISITDNLENEIECPRCHEIMTLCSEFDLLYYKCEECNLPLYTSPSSNY